MTEPIRIISLGAGVQSTTMALMSLYGELPRVEHWIFADTQDEPAEVYRHLDKLEAEAGKYGVTLHRATFGRLSLGLLGLARQDWQNRHSQIPCYTTDGIGKRQCTTHFKLDPIHRVARTLSKIPGQHRWEHVEMWIGISCDEIHRMKESRMGWLVNRWPLVELRMSRHDCLRWLTAHSWTATKSACIYCPYHGAAEWRRIMAMPDEWARVVAIDRELNKRGEYLHRSLTPIDQVDFRTDEQKGQGNLFGNECEGMCGV